MSGLGDETGFTQEDRFNNMNSTPSFLRGIGSMDRPEWNSGMKPSQAKEDSNASTIFMGSTKEAIQADVETKDREWVGWTFVPSESRFEDMPVLNTPVYSFASPTSADLSLLQPMATPLPASRSGGLQYSGDSFVTPARARLSDAALVNGSNPPRTIARSSVKARPELSDKKALQKMEKCVMASVPRYAMTTPSLYQSHAKARARDLVSVAEQTRRLAGAHARAVHPSRPGPHTSMMNSVPSWEQLRPNSPEPPSPSESDQEEGPVQHEVLRRPSVCSCTPEENARSGYIQALMEAAAATSRPDQGEAPFQPPQARQQTRREEAPSVNVNTPAHDLRSPGSMDRLEPGAPSSSPSINVSESIERVPSLSPSSLRGVEGLERVSSALGKIERLQRTPSLSPTPSENQKDRIPSDSRPGYITLSRTSSQGGSSQESVASGVSYSSQIARRGRSTTSPSLSDRGRQAEPEEVGSGIGRSGSTRTRRVGGEDLEISLGLERENAHPSQKVFPRSTSQRRVPSSLVRPSGSQRVFSGERRRVLSTSSSYRGNGEQAETEDGDVDQLTLDLEALRSQLGVGLELSVNTLRSDS